MIGPDCTAPTTAFWRNRSVLVAGGFGFIGSHLVDRLTALGARAVAVSRRTGYDFRESGDVVRALSEVRPSVLFNCAAQQGGVEYQRRCPGQILYNNTLIQINSLEGARLVGVPRYVNIIPACAYPAETRDGLYYEEDFEGGAMHPSADNYGITKRLAVMQARYYQDQYGQASSLVVLANTYGPRDHFETDHSHVLAALLRRFLAAVRTGQDEVVVWGRGVAERDLLYVDDAIEGVLRIVEHRPDSGLLNIGTAQPWQIREVAALVAEVVGYGGRIVYDSTRPEGPLRKALATDRLQATLGWTPPTPLRAGVSQTSLWLEQHHEEILYGD